VRVRGDRAEEDPVVIERGELGIGRRGGDERDVGIPGQLQEALRQHRRRRADDDIHSLADEVGERLLDLLRRRVSGVAADDDDGGTVHPAGGIDLAYRGFDTGDLRRPDERHATARREQGADLQLAIARGGGCRGGRGGRRRRAAASGESDEHGRGERRRGDAR
jgi:hypothetical protein